MVSLYDGFDYLDVTVEDGIALVRLNRPERANAYSADDRDEMSRIIPILAGDNDVKVVVVTGTGKHFCAGAIPEVLEAFASSPEARARAQSGASGQVAALLAFEKPLVAAVNGAIGGAAMSFAFLSDILIVEEQVRFREGRVLLALAAGNIGVLTWPTSMGMMKAKRYLLTGDELSAPEAERLGLVTEVVDTGASLERAMTYARRFAAGPTNAVRYTKRALHLLYSPAAIAAELSLALEIVTGGEPEAGEAIHRAFAGEGFAFPPDT